MKEQLRKICSYLAPIFLLLALISAIYPLVFGIYGAVITFGIVTVAFVLSLVGKSNIFVRVICGLGFVGMVLILVCIIYSEIQFVRQADLATAVFNHDVWLVKRKIAEGYDVNAKDESGKTMLTRACSIRFNRNYEVFSKNSVDSHAFTGVALTGSGFACPATELRCWKRLSPPSSQAGNSREIR